MGENVRRLSSWALVTSLGIIFSSSIHLPETFLISFFQYLLFEQEQTTDTVNLTDITVDERYKRYR